MQHQTVQTLNELGKARHQVIVELDHFGNVLNKIYLSYPALFPKRPADMSITDKLRFSEDLINFIDVLQQYQGK